MAKPTKQEEEWKKQLRKDRQKRHIAERKILTAQQKRILELRGIEEEQLGQDDNGPEEDQYDEGQEEGTPEEREERHSRDFDHDTRRMREEIKKAGERDAAEARAAGTATRGAGAAARTAGTVAEAGTAAGTTATTGAAAVTAGTAVAAEGTVAVAAVGTPIWATIGIILLIILGVFLMIIMIFAPIIYMCNEGGAVARGVSYVAAWVGVIPVDICSALSFEGGGGFGGGGASGSFCTPDDNIRLAEESGVPARQTNSQDLIDLIACVERHRLVEAFLVDGKLPGSKFTYENENPSCNYTRGSTECGPCAHSEYSCHYGGLEGSNGAEAVDFGLGEVRDEGLFAAVEAAATDCAGPGGFVRDEIDHIHVSTAACDTDVRE